MGNREIGKREKWRADALFFPFTVHRSPFTAFEPPMNADNGKAWQRPLCKPSLAPLPPRFLRQENLLQSGRKGA
jgi:hypothetical protein